MATRSCCFRPLQVAELVTITSEPIDTAVLREGLFDPTAGGYSAFEGWVRNHNDGREVERLEYEAYEPVAVSEGEKIIAEANELFPFVRASFVHRVGLLEIGECAVWVGVVARHRDEAFRACRYIIDELKLRLPIWKKEHYVDGDSDWVNCERCSRSSGESMSKAAASHATDSTR